MSDYARTAELLERVVTERGYDISPWAQTELYTNPGRLYIKSGIDIYRQSRIEEACRKLNKLRAEGNGVERRFAGLTEIHDKILSSL